MYARLGKEGTRRGPKLQKPQRTQKDRPLPLLLHTYIWGFRFLFVPPPDCPNTCGSSPEEPKILRPIFLRCFRRALCLVLARLGGEEGAAGLTGGAGGWVGRGREEEGNKREGKRKGRKNNDENVMMIMRRRMGIMIMIMVMAKIRGKSGSQRGIITKKE